MQFRIKSLSTEAGFGHTVLHASDPQDARRQADAMGLTVLSIRRVVGFDGLRRSPATSFPLLLFCQELLSLLDSGITVMEAIETLAEKESRPAVRSSLIAVMARLREGLPLSDAMERLPLAFPALFVATVRASERSSGLAEALGRYVAYAGQLAVLRAKLVSAAIYPVLLIGVSGLVVLFLLGYVVPRFSHIYEDLGSNLPFMSQLLLHWGRLVEHYWPALLGLLVVLAIALLNGAWRLLAQRLLQWCWRVPALGERVRVFQLARMYRTLGMLLRGGIAIVPALEMVTGLLSAALQGQLRVASLAVRQGQPLSSAFDTAGLTTAVANRMLRVGERAGNMGEMMERIAAFHDEEMARWADWATRLIGPLLMLLVGVVIGGIVLLMYLPIFQLAESIR